MSSSPPFDAAGAPDPGSPSDRADAPAPKITAESPPPQHGADVDPPDPEALSVPTKLAFGAPALAGAAMAIPIGVLMPNFYSDVVLVPLGTVALSIAIARSLDALTDPLMGWITDRTRSRWGRRKPWIAFGVPLTALCFFALFSPPQGLEPRDAGFWFAGSFALYFLFHTIYQIPHGALGAELTLDYNERSSLFGYQALFIQVGTITASAAPVLMISQLGPGSERAAFSSVALVIAVLLVGLYGLLLWKVPERPEFMHRPSNPLVPGVRRAMRNRPFRILFTAGLLNAVPAAIPAVLLPYLVKYVLQPENPDLWLAIYLVTFLATGMLCVPIWMAVTRRIGKLRAFCSAAAVGIVANCLFYFLGPGDTGFALAIFLLAGTQSAVGQILIPSMGADTIDYDELLTGKRREAQFGAFWAIVPKFVSIPGSSIPIAILAAVGFVPNQVQSEDVLFTIRFLIAVFPAGFYVAALLTLLRYPITEAYHVDIRRGIAAHARGDDVVDPITGIRLGPPQQRSVEESMGWYLDYFSPGELRRLLAKGASRVRLDVIVMIVISTVATAGFAFTAWHRVEGLDQEPGLAAVLAVVAAGLSLTASCFHAVRLRPVQRLASAPPPQDVVRAHLEAIEGASGSAR